jgi:hypothetical protein
MGRGLGVNKPCVKCGREVPYSFKSPIPGFCGRCTDEVLRTLGHAPREGGGLGTRDAMLIGASPGQKAGWAAIGGVIAVLLCVLFAAFAPGAFDAVRDGLRALFGLG